MTRATLYLEHMLECIANIEADTEGDKNNLLEDRRRRDAVLRNLQVLAESSKRLPEEIRSAHPEVPWRDLADFRNVIVHDYLGIDIDEIWEIIADDLPPLKAQLQRILAS